MGLFRRIIGENSEPVVRRQKIQLRGPVELRDGHPVLTEEMRAQLERAGVDPVTVEAQLAAPPGPGGTSSVRTSLSISTSIREPNGQMFTLPGDPEQRDGHPVLDDQTLAELEQRGIDPALVETQFASARSEQSQWQASYTSAGDLCSCSFSENGVTGSFEIRAGRPFLTADSRAELGRRGVDVAAFEAAFQARVEVNEYEQIVARTAPATAAKTGITEPAKPFYRKPSEEDLLRGSSSSHGD